MLFDYFIISPSNTLTKISAPRHSKSTHKFVPAIRKLEFVLKSLGRCVIDKYRIIP